MPTILHALNVILLALPTEAILSSFKYNRPSGFSLWSNAQSHVEQDAPFLEAIRQMSLDPTGGDRTSDEDARRLFHGRGGCFPGCEHLALDWFPPVLLLTSFRQISDEVLETYRSEIALRWRDICPSEPLNLVYQCRADSTSTRLVAGTVPNPHIIRENGDKYLVHLLRGQNLGLFLDMANGRQWVKKNAQTKNVLNLFAYTCAFSVAALSGGARKVVNVDMSRGALKIGQRNHEMNGLKGSSFLGHDVFKTWGKIRREGRYDIIVIDPPTYQKGSFIAKKDYIKLIRRIPTLLSPGGHVLLCLNAPELDTDFLRCQVDSAAPELVFVNRLENPSSFPVIDRERALKVLLYQLPDAEDV